MSERALLVYLKLQVESLISDGSLGAEILGMSRRVWYPILTCLVCVAGDSPGNGRVVGNRSWISRQIF